MHITIGNLLRQWEAHHGRLTERRRQAAHRAAVTAWRASEDVGYRPAIAAMAAIHTALTA